MNKKTNIFALFICMGFSFFAEAKEHFSYTCLEGLTDDKSDDKFVALTFDDGPSKATTPEIMSILNENSIKATFFVLGSRVKAHPDIVLSLKKSGHEIANHSYSHPKLPEGSASSIAKELEETNDELAKLQIEPKWFRPPYGSFNATVKTVAFENDMHSILWSLDSKDWKRPSAEVLKQRILSKVESGEVILLHDIHKSTLKALPGIIDALKARGYTFVTLTEWYNKLQSRSPSQRLLCSR